MAVIAAETARGARASGDVVSGVLLALGAAALFMGTLFYARLTPELGLPALPAERTQALADALNLGPRRLGRLDALSFEDSHRPCNMFLSVETIFSVRFPILDDPFQGGADCFFKFRSTQGAPRHHRTARC